MTTSTIQWREDADGGISAFLGDGSPYPFRWKPDKFGQLQPQYIDDPSERIVWAALPGAQSLFISCPHREALLHGNRGGGKTETLLACFTQHVGKDFGSAWQGVIFREHYRELGEVIKKSREVIGRSFPGAKLKESPPPTWTWPTGEKLIFGYMARPDDVEAWQGWELPFVGFEELTNFPFESAYLRMFATQRRSNPSIPLMMRATCNPSGIGHNWVKERFRLSGIPQSIVGEIIDDATDDEGNREPTRVSIFSDARENKVLLHAQPDYLETVAATADTEAQREAWARCNWDIVAGGMFNDRWRSDVHVIDVSDVLIEFIAAIPSSWRIDRSYDDGQSAPFSVGFWAESNGEPMKWRGRMIGQVRGDLVRVSEWYGWNGKPNKGMAMDSKEIGRGILERIKALNLKGRVRPGPADSAIWSPASNDPNKSVAGDMASVGVHWEQANKSAGTRVHGWKQIRGRLKGAIPDKDGRREDPGLFVTSACKQFLRTVPVLERSEKNPDDISEKAEDHIADETRYRVLAERRTAKSSFSAFI